MTKTEQVDDLVSEGDSDSEDEDDCSKICLSALRKLSLANESSPQLIPMTDHVIPPEVVELYGSWMFEQQSRGERT
ncbi:hypothetical protein Peur_049669 [Populus x canadensis]